MPQTVTGVQKLKINRLTKTQFDGASPSNTEIYAVDPEFSGSKLLATDSNGDIIESTATEADAAAGGTAIQSVQINGTDLTPDTNKKVNIEKASNDGTVVGVVQLSNTYGSQTVSGYLAAVDRSYNGFVGAQSTSIASVGGVKAYVGGTSVAYNASQSLTDAQKEQARTNIGAGAKTIIREWVG